MRLVYDRPEVGTRVVVIDRYNEKVIRRGFLLAYCNYWGETKNPKGHPRDCFDYVKVSSAPGQQPHRKNRYYYKDIRVEGSEEYK